jgi:hypothetical protein
MVEKESKKCESVCPGSKNQFGGTQLYIFASGFACFRRCKRQFTLIGWIVKFWVLIGSETMCVCLVIENEKNLEISDRRAKPLKLPSSVKSEISVISASLL